MRTCRPPRGEGCFGSVKACHRPGAARRNGERTEVDAPARRCDWQHEIAAVTNNPDDGTLREPLLLQRDIDIRLPLFQGRLREDAQVVEEQRVVAEFFVAAG